MNKNMRFRILILTFRSEKTLYLCRYLMPGEVPFLMYVRKGTSHLRMRICNTYGTAHLIGPICSFFGDSQLTCYGFRSPLLLQLINGSYYNRFTSGTFTTGQGALPLRVAVGQVWLTIITSSVKLHQGEAEAYTVTIMKVNDKFLSFLYVCCMTFQW